MATPETIPTESLPRPRLQALGDLAMPETFSGDSQEVTSPEFEVPDIEWWTVGAMASGLKISTSTIQNILPEVATDHPEWIEDHLDNNNTLRPHYHRDLAIAIRRKYDEIPPVPDGWATANSIAAKMKVNPAAIYRYASKGSDPNEPQTVLFRDSRGNPRDFYPPERVTEIETFLITRHTPPPDGWTPLPELIQDLKVDRSVIDRIIKKEGTKFELLTGEYKVGNCAGTRCLDPKLVKIVEVELAKRRPVPSGWKNITEISNKFDKSWDKIRSLVDKEMQDYPDDIGTFAKRGRALNVYVSPDAIKRIEQQLLEHPEAPEGWATQTQAVEFIKRPKQTIASAAEKYREAHPEWFQQFGINCQPFEHYSPELIKVLTTEFEQRTAHMRGWEKSADLCSKAEIGSAVMEALLAPYRSSHPEWFRKTDGIRGHSVDYLSPELITELDEKLSKYVLPPEGWMDPAELGRLVGRSSTTILKRTRKYRESNPEWWHEYKTAGTGPGRGRLTEHYHPDLVKLMIAECVPMAPKGWQTLNQIREYLGRDPKAVQAFIDEYQGSNSKLFKKYVAKSGHLLEHYPPELITELEAHFGIYDRLPDGDWITNRALAKALRRSQEVIEAFANEYRETNPEWFGTFRGKKGINDYYSPELRELVEASVGMFMGEGRQQRQEAARMREEVQDFLGEVQRGESLEAQEFRAMAELFGAERTMDILYQFRPDYRKIPVPYVRSVIADYLGDFMNLRGELSLDTLEAGAEFLVDKNLRDGLTEVVKDGCLRIYNETRLSDSSEEGLHIITDYLDGLRAHSGDFQNEYFTEVLDTVQEYYRAAFEDIQKPAALLDELREGRLFPDLNQRINIKEISDKKKMLIADEMGVGKSASAILAKEHLQVKHALVVAPSNVIDTWRAYLSSQSEDAEIQGYFKPGSEPNVLVVESIEQLKGDLSQYDYVLLSQERLNDEYTAALAQYDFGMLIVDEAHKLKNLKFGKRAENLLQLASRIEGDDKYLALLSGTPIPNKVGDVAMVLKLLYPEQFGEIDNRELVRQIVKGDVLDLRSLLVPRMEMKSLAESVSMPELTEVTHEVALSSEEQQVYEMLVDEDELTASQKLQILRQFALNPRLIELTPDVAGSKMRAVGAQLKETFAAKDKVVMFVNGYIEGVIRGEDTIFNDLGLPSDVTIYTIHGEVSKADRLQIEAKLKQSGQKFLLAVSGQTADVGVDFSGAEEVIFYNEPWTKYDKKQQLGRVFRPGLQNSLVSHTFVTENTIEAGIHTYIESKYTAIEKLLRGIPLSEIERQLVRNDEQADPDLEVNADLAEYYFSSWDRMMNIYKYVKEMGEDNFTDFLGRYGQEYADCYTDLGSRSYQANASRLSGTLLSTFATQKRQDPSQLRVLDVASGPEMLKRHAPEKFADSITSIDLNPHHFAADKGKRAVGSFLNLPVKSGSMDYINLSLALHYTSFAPSRGNYERLKLLQEMNRVLKVGGRGIINMMYTLDLKNLEGFHEVAAKTGFKIVEKYSGPVESGDNFRTRLITLEKVGDSPESTAELVKTFSPSTIKGLMLTRKPTALKDSRKVVSDFVLNGSTNIKTQFNADDAAVLKEEQLVLRQMNMLRARYKDIKHIPAMQIQAGGFARFFNGRSYVLFKRLASATGAIITR